MSLSRQEMADELSRQEMEDGLDMQQIIEKLSQHAKTYPEFILNQVTFMVWIIFYSGLPRIAIPDLIFSDLVSTGWELKSKITRGNKSFTVDPELNQHWVQYMAFLETNIPAPLTFEQNVFPDLKKTSLIERYLKEIFWAGAFNNIRNAGIRECFKKNRDNRKHKNNCISIAGNHYGKTRQQIDSIVTGSTPRPRRTEADKLRTAIFIIQEKIDCASKDGLPHSPVDIQERDDLTNKHNLLLGCKKNEYI